MLVSAMRKEIEIKKQRKSPIEMCFRLPEFTRYLS